MKVLYVCRKLLAHDVRFLNAFTSYRLGAAVLSLEDSELPQAAIRLSSAVKIAGMLGMDLDQPGCFSAAGHAYSSAVARCQPDVVLAGALHDGAYVAACGNISAPLIVQSWARDVLWEASWSADARNRCRTSLAVADGVFVDCHAVLRKCEQLAGQPVANPYVMPWGLDRESMPPASDRDRIRSELGISARRAIVCTRGMEAIYGVDTLLETFLRVYREIPDSVLMWPGDGSLRGTVADFIEQHALEGSIWTPGNLPHDLVLNLFAAADCYVSCSECDGTSISLLEAMNAGLPLVVSDVGGNPEWVSIDNGRVVPVRNVGGFAAAIKDVLMWPPEHRQRGAAYSRSLVSTRANWDVIFPAFIDFLRSVASAAANKSALRN